MVKGSENNRMLKKAVFAHVLIEITEIRFQSLGLAVGDFNPKIYLKKLITQNQLFSWIVFARNLNTCSYEWHELPINRTERGFRSIVNSDLWKTSFSHRRNRSTDASAIRFKPPSLIPWFSKQSGKNLFLQWLNNFTWLLHYWIRKSELNHL